MTITISPQQAASFATFAYSPLSSTAPLAEMMSQNANTSLLGEILDRKSLSGFEGTTGGALAGTRSRFGVMADGAGPFKGHKFVAIRGTDTTPDWLTNLNCGFSPGPGGHVVHAGFYKTYQSLMPQIANKTKSHMGAIHVIGHSLGGALAGLVAYSLAGRGRSVSLYTFGAPRAGFSGYAQDKTKNLASIKRVFHHGDPVAMVPLFPFVHGPVPVNPGTLRIGAANTGISTSYHGMAWYRPAVKDLSWDQLQAENQAAFQRRSIEYWLGKADLFVGIPFSSMGLRYIGRALDMIIKSAAIKLQLAASGAATTLDMLAQLMHMGMSALSSLGEQIKKWVNLAMRWLGKSLSEAASQRDPSQDFIVTLLRAMAAPVLASASTALMMAASGQLL